MRNLPFARHSECEAVRDAQRNKICVTYQFWIHWFTVLCRTVISSFLVAAAFAFAPSTPAQASSIEGRVRGVDGRPLQNAEVHIVRQDKTGAPVTIQTNAKGSYASSALPTGTYKISVVENGKVKSNVTIETAGKTARVDFDLKSSGGNGVKHYVLVKGDWNPYRPLLGRSQCGRDPDRLRSEYAEKKPRTSAGDVKAADE